jgi:hypothetical protein
VIVALEAASMNKRWTPEQAERELEAWRSSKQSMEAFERERGVPAHRLRYWIKRVGAGGSRGRTQHSVSLLPVRVAAAGTGAGVEVILPGGCVVRVGPGFDDDVLLRVLTLLGNAR